MLELAPNGVCRFVKFADPCERKGKERQSDRLCRRQVVAEPRNPLVEVDAILAVDVVYRYHEQEYHPSLQP